jgi:hypothetical protein
MRLIEVIPAIPIISPPPGEPVTIPEFARTPIELAPGIWLGPAPFAEQILDASQPAGHNTPRPIRQFRSLYAFYRTYENPPYPDRHDFDSDHQLRTTLQLSRLIRPTSTSWEYAAQVWESNDNELEILPAGFTGVGSQAFVLNEDSDWLRDEDGHTLRELLKAFTPETLPERITRALWYHEYLCWLYLVDVRWPLGVTALESLVHTNDFTLPRSKRLGSTAQFVMRLMRLRELVPDLRWTTEDLEAIYDRRSALVHGVGKSAGEIPDEDRRLIGLQEEGLRAILLAGITRPNLAAVFNSEDSVRTSLGAVRPAVPSAGLL